MSANYRAAVCVALDGPDAVEIQSLPALAIKSGEVRVAIKAAGLNFPDLLMTRGEYQFRPDPPFTPGVEFAGEVLEIAEDVTTVAIGDRVMGGNKGGCFAEQIVLPAASLSTLPDALSFEEGACWSSAAITAWHALHDKAGLVAGESVLILGAAGGVGMAAVKLAKHMGALVIGTASTPTKREAISAAGADHALDPADPELASQIKALTGGKGCAVVFDPVGGDLAITATRSIAVGGRYLIVGFASGKIPNFPANHAMIKEYSLIGVRAGESSRRDPELGARNKKKLAEFAAARVMAPYISHRLKLDDVVDALKLLESREVIGRAVLTMV